MSQLVRENLKGRGEGRLMRQTFCDRVGLIILFSTGQSEPSLLFLSPLFARLAWQNKLHGNGYRQHGSEMTELPFYQWIPEWARKGRREGEIRRNLETTSMSWLSTQWHGGCDVLSSWRRGCCVSECIILVVADGCSRLNQIWLISTLNQYLLESADPLFDSW